MFLTLNPVAFRLGPLSVKWYGIIMATAVLVATLMAIQEGKRRHIMPDDFSDLLLWAIPIGFVCARAYYVIFEWGYFSKYPDVSITIRMEIHGDMDLAERSVWTTSTTMKIRWMPMIG